MNKFQDKNQDIQNTLCSEIMIDEQSHSGDMSMFKGKARRFTKLFNETQESTFISKKGKINVRKRNSSKLENNSMKNGGTRLFCETSNFVSATENRQEEMDNFTTETLTELQSVQRSKVTTQRLYESKGTHSQSQLSLQQFAKKSSQLKKSSTTKHIEQKFQIREEYSRRTLKSIKNRNETQSIASLDSQDTEASNNLLRKRQQYMQTGNMQRSKDEIKLLNMQNIFQKNKKKKRHQSQSQQDIVTVTDQSLIHKKESAINLSIMRLFAPGVNNCFSSQSGRSQDANFVHDHLKSLSGKDLQQANTDIQNKERQQTVPIIQAFNLQPKNQSAPLINSAEAEVPRDTRNSLLENSYRTQKGVKKNQIALKKLLLNNKNQLESINSNSLDSLHSKTHDNDLQVSQNFLDRIQNNAKQTAEKIVYQKYKGGITFADTIQQSTNKPQLITKKLQIQKVGQKPKKEKKQKCWPSQEIPNQYAKANLQYNFRQEKQQKKNNDIIFSEDDSSHCFQTSESSVALLGLNKSQSTTKIDIIKQTPTDIDKLYKLSNGEKKASQLVKLYNKRRHQDIAQARQNAKTEVKFRELYDKRVTLPTEFSILPHPSEIFEEDKAREKIVEIQDMNASVAAAIQERSQIHNTTVSLSGKGYGGQTSASGLGYDVTSRQSIQPQSILKRSSQIAPGVLSNNLGKSHLLKFINKEHQQKVQEKDRLQAKKEHYMISPARSKHSITYSQQKSVIESLGGGSFRNPHESFITDNIQSQNGMPQNKKRGMSVDSGRSRSFGQSHSPATKPANLNLNLVTQGSNTQLLTSSKQFMNIPSFGQVKQKSSRRLLGFKRLNQLGIKSTHKQGIQKASDLINFDLVQIRNFPGVNINSDPVHTTQRLYKEFIKNALDRAQTMYQHKDWQTSIDLLNQIIPVAQYALDLQDTMMLYQLIASIEYQRKDYAKTLQVCHLVIYLCSDRESLRKIRLDMLKTTGMCHMRTQQYDDALQAWKLCFEQCIRTGEDQSEIQCYEQMSYCYFYLGQMKTAEYFNTRWRMGMLEEPDSQMKQIYTSMRKNENRANKWQNQIQFVSDPNWNGETIFQVIYKKFLEDCLNKEKICNDLMVGKVRPVFDSKRCRLSKLLAVGLMKYLGRVLKKVQKKQVKVPQLQNNLIELEPKWREAYHLSKIKNDLKDLNNLRIQIYNVCKQTKLTETLPIEFQYELELIGDFIQTQNHLRLNPKANIIVDRQKDAKKYQNRILKVHNLGTITLNDYNLPLMPTPQLVNIEKLRFDFKNSIRNADYRSGKQYDSLELQQIFPGLYSKAFKKQAVPYQYYAPQKSLPHTTDPDYKKSLIQRARLCKSGVRDQVYMSHLTVDRIVQGKFKSEAERKKHYFRYFLLFNNKIRAEIEQNKQSNPLNPAKIASSDHTKSYMNDLESRRSHINLRSSEQNQLEQAKGVLQQCMPIRAFIYGQDVTKDLIKFNNRLTCASRIIKEHNGDFKNFTETSFNEQIMTLSGNYSFTQQAKVKSKYLQHANPSSSLKEQDNLLQFFASMGCQESSTNIITNGNHPQVRFQQQQANRLRHPSSFHISSRVSPSPKVPSSVAFSSLSKRSSHSDFFENQELSDQDQLSIKGGGQGGGYSTLIDSSPPRLQKQLDNLQQNKMRKAITPLKLQLKEVIHEEEKEETIPKTKEIDSTRKRKATRKRSSMTVNLSPCLDTANKSDFGEYVHKNVKIQSNNNGKIVLPIGEFSKHSAKISGSFKHSATDPCLFSSHITPSQKMLKSLILEK